MDSSRGIMSRNIKGNAEGNIGGFDGLSNNDNMLLSQSPGTVDYQNVNNDSTQDPYSIADVLNSGSLKGSMNVEDPLIEDIVNPSLDPEIANEPNNELMSPLISSINFDNMMHRPPSAAGMYNTGAESDHATLPTEPLRSESMLQHTSDVDSGSSLAMNKKRFLMKAQDVYKRQPIGESKLLFGLLTENNRIIMKYTRKSPVTITALGKTCL